MWWLPWFDKGSHPLPKLPGETSIQFEILRWVGGFWKIILTLLVKLNMKRELWKESKFNSIDNQPAIDNEKWDFDHSAVLVSFGTQYQFSGSFLAN